MAAGGNLGAGGEGGKAGGGIIGREAVLRPRGEVAQLGPFAIGEAGNHPDRQLVAHPVKQQIERFQLMHVIGRRHHVDEIGLGEKVSRRQGGGASRIQRTGEPRLAIIGAGRGGAEQQDHSQQEAA